MTGPELRLRIYDVRLQILNQTIETATGLTVALYRLVSEIEIFAREQHTDVQHVLLL